MIYAFHFINRWYFSIQSTILKLSGSSYANTKNR